jgi:hypothetical protein
MAYNMQNSETMNFQERRSKNNDRRTEDYRRTEMERRADYRNDPKGQPKGILRWLKSKKSARLGVDRRKDDRRTLLDRRQQKYLEGILTQDEISDLLEMIDKPE